MRLRLSLAAAVAATTLLSSATALAAPLASPQAADTPIGSAAAVGATSDHVKHVTVEHEVYATAREAQRHLMREKGGSSLPRRYDWLIDQYGPGSKPVRWNPCTPITWSFPRGTAQDTRFIQRAMDRVSAINGLEFQEVDRGGLVEMSYAQYGPSPLGTAGFKAESTGNFWYPTSGTLTLNKRLAPAKSDYSKQVQYQVILHEVGHLVGLNHVSDRKQIMYPTSQGNLSDYRSGDKAGLRQLGEGAGCYHIPTVSNLSLQTPATGEGVEVRFRAPTYDTWTDVDVKLDTSWDSSRPDSIRTVGDNVVASFPDVECSTSASVVITGGNQWGEVFEMDTMKCPGT